jgi:hypothetical protein
MERIAKDDCSYEIEKRIGNCDFSQEWQNIDVWWLDEEDALNILKGFRKKEAKSKNDKNLMDECIEIYTKFYC